MTAVEHALSWKLHISDSHFLPYYLWVNHCRLEQRACPAVKLDSETQQFFIISMSLPPLYVWLGGGVLLPLCTCELCSKEAGNTICCLLSEGNKVRCDISLKGSQDNSLKESHPQKVLAVTLSQPIIHSNFLCP